jgi:lupus La protein
LESIRLRRTETGLFKGSVIVQFKSQTDAEKFLSEPHEWDGNLLEQKTKKAWIQGKKDEDQKLSEIERQKHERERKKNSGKHFSAYKEMDRQKTREQTTSRKKDNRRGRLDGKRRYEKRERTNEDTDRSKMKVDPLPVVEKAPSLFNISGRSGDGEQNGKRAADEELNGNEPKKSKVEES